ncbi:MAG: HD domain-containing protein [Deltaproteobacteria bacterium]|nr:MAG: HD domain-containing protein [Deltaproteobacteria bacterium]
MSKDSFKEDDYPLGVELTEKLRQLADPYHDGMGGCHGPDHTERVHKTALHIGRLMGAKLDVLSAAALLHDIGRRYETREQGKVCHAEKGAELAREILAKLDFTPARIEEIAHCIEAHRYRGDMIPKTLEAKILYDADKLDSIGAVGIGRAFLFAGQTGAKLHNESDVDILDCKPYSKEDTAYREFKFKMSKIKDRMQTPEGKRLAEERHGFMEVFFERLERETKGAENMVEDLLQVASERR